jgi:uncharacterized protein (TIGR02145 family)
MKALKRILFLVVVIPNLFVFYGCDKKKKKEIVKPVFETGSVTDVDGRVYKTVKIGNQWWMAEDLKVTKYNNGDNILTPSSVLQWESDTSIYCVNGNNYYYKWKVVIDTRKLAPEGWHIPSDNEWKQLEIALGMSNSDADKLAWRGNLEGNKLKQDNLDAVVWGETKFMESANESGFSALPNNCRLFNGVYGSPLSGKGQGFWWSASEYSKNEAWFRNLDHKNTNIFRSHVLKTYGFCIRCVKN